MVFNLVANILKLLSRNNWILWFVNHLAASFSFYCCVVMLVFSCFSASFSVFRSVYGCYVLVNICHVCYYSAANILTAHSYTNKMFNNQCTLLANRQSVNEQDTSNECIVNTSGCFCWGTVHVVSKISLLGSKKNCCFCGFVVCKAVAIGVKSCGSSSLTLTSNPQDCHKYYRSLLLRNCIASSILIQWTLHFLVRVIVL